MANNDYDDEFDETADPVDEEPEGDVDDVVVVEVDENGVVRVRIKKKRKILLLMPKP